MRKLILVLAFMAGCSSPAQTYVEADAAARAPYDQDHRLDSWVDSSSLSPEEKDALHQLNDARRARVAHALAGFHK